MITLYDKSKDKYRVVTRLLFLYLFRHHKGLERGESIDGNVVVPATIAFKLLILSLPFHISKERIRYPSNLKGLLAFSSIVYTCVSQVF